MFFTGLEKLGCSSEGQKSWDVLPTGCRTGTLFVTLNRVKKENRAALALVPNLT